MTINIKTSLITLTIEDEPTISGDNYTKRVLPELPIALKSAIDEAIRLHQEVSASERLFKQN